MHKYSSPPILFRSKADTLNCLQKHSSLSIPNFLTYTFAQWKSNSLEILKECVSFPSDFLAVRSSCLKEDSESSSGAGAFTSILNVRSGNAESLNAAIDTVFSSYSEPCLEDQVIIQNMLEDVMVSGVIMTKVPSDGSPYYVINYDDISGKTDAITGGMQTGKTVYIYRGARPLDFDSERLYSYVLFCQKIENICNNDALDIEFCQDSQGIIHLLQVRPICTQAHWISQSDSYVKSNIKLVNDFVASQMHTRPSIFGSRTILGVMPDWNPAEMIGITPRNLASSLYKELITKDIWRKARSLMGYRELPPTELMLLIGGRPFIDVRASFNSFLPRGIDASTAEILINAWLDRLNNHFELHDKVEFEIAQTIYDFSFDQNFKERYGQLLASKKKQEYKEQLQELTLNCLNLEAHGSLNQAFMAIEELKKRQWQNKLLAQKNKHILLNIAILIEECRQYGTLPFSVIARHAFIAEALLKTAVKRGALDTSRLSLFKMSIETVAGLLNKAFEAVCNGKMTNENFMKYYGHLRPGSYDILSPRYADRKGFFKDEISICKQEEKTFIFTEKESHALNLLLTEAGLDKINIRQFEQYARLCIAGRENAKFIFTRHLSNILESLAMWGEGIGLSREYLSFLNIQDCLKGLSQTMLRHPKELFKELSEQGRQLYDLTRSLKLSYLIRSERDIYIAPQHRSAPNFVGSIKIEGAVICLCATSSYDIVLDNCIVCIENADPGFDWIFTRNIAGLITMFGGINSHMAIRCAEYGLPAAIGVGERLFTKVAAATYCILDAQTCNITVR